MRPHVIFLDMRWPSLNERFWAKVEKTDPCWLWYGSKRTFGHGRLKLGKHTLAAHRVSWEIHFGNIPNGLCVLHRCDNPSCVRPDHLFLGTKSDNNVDRDSKDRQAKGDRNGSRIHRDRMPRGVANIATKLTPSDVIEIRRRFASGETQTRIAKDFPVCQSQNSHSGWHRHRRASRPARNGHW